METPFFLVDKPGLDVQRVSEMNYTFDSNVKFIGMKVINVP